MYNQFFIFLFESQLLPAILVAFLGLSVWGGRTLGLYQKSHSGGARLRPDEISVGALFGLMNSMGVPGAIAGFGDPAYSPLLHRPATPSTGAPR